MADWPTVRLGDHVDLTVGFAFKSKEFTDDLEDVRLVRGANIGQGTLKWDQERRFPAERYAEFERFHLCPGDVVLAMDRPWIAAGLKWAVVGKDETPALLVQRVARLRGTDSLADEFIRYIIGSPDFEAYVQPIVTGVNVPHISGSQIEGFSFRLPPFETQKEIARLLGTLDDLIENNRRRIEILEEMARSIYREWFVHLRFPGHEDVELIDSDLGPLPAGWSHTTLGEAAEWKSGGTPSTRNPDLWDGDIPWITSGSLSSFLLDDSDRKLTRLGVENGSRVVERDTTVIVVRGMSLAKEFRHGIADRSLAFGQDCKALIARDNIDPLYLAFAVSSLADDIQRMVEFAAHGTGKLSTDRVQAIAIPLPPAVVQQQFTGIVRPMRELMSNLRGQLRVLQEARDLLLPRLISGELDVSDLDLEPVA